MIAAAINVDTEWFWHGPGRVTLGVFLCAPRKPLHARSPPRALGNPSADISGGAAEARVRLVACRHEKKESPASADYPGGALRRPTTSVKRR